MAPSDLLKPRGRAPLVAHAEGRAMVPVMGSSGGGGAMTMIKEVKNKLKASEKEEKMRKKAEKEASKQGRKEAEARGALFLHHWKQPVLAAATATTAAAVVIPQGEVVTGSSMSPTALPSLPAEEFVSMLQKDLKKLEKISKDAAWYSAKETSDGAQHILLVTTDAKHACKYEMEEITADEDPEGGGAAGVKTVLLGPGAEDRVEIPVAELKAAAIQLHGKMMMDSSDSSMSSQEEDDDMKGGSSDEEDEEVTKGMKAAAAAMMPKMKKGEKKKKKDKEEKMGKEGKEEKMDKKDKEEKREKGMKGKDKEDDSSDDDCDSSSSDSDSSSSSGSDEE